MSKLQKLSGHKLIKIFSKLDFISVRQKGSHVIRIKYTDDGKVGCTIPLHKELKIGTIKGILRQAKITEDDFLDLI
ncbi:MAG: type II toxin-antitoxin system HicA family toxin [Candidatus Aenigmarchaeota archaeon]|nr:type II toxin-antitoxin system HicA family toxin [Candidatus Aenigmarchaeota archaeon]